MRGPSQSLVIDTNILLGIALGSNKRQRELYDCISQSHTILLSERGLEEVKKVAADFVTKRPGVDRMVDLLLRQVMVIEAFRYSSLMTEAANCLRLAVPSRNGSTTDAHVLALGWLTASDIWSGDRDFAGTGWPSWSSANLLRALELPG